MSILDTFFILFEGDTSKLDKGIAEADKKSASFIDKLKTIDKAATSAGGNFRDLIGKAAGIAGIGLSLGAIVAGIRSTAREYMELSKLAAQFRDTAEAVDQFRDAAGLLGISQERSTESLKSMERVIQDVILDMGRAKKVFEELKIEVKDGAGHIKSTTTLMGELSNKFKTLDRGTQIRVMERLGLDPGLLKLFNSDLGALQRRMADVDRAAGFNLQTAVKRAEEYTKASRALNVEFKTITLYLSKLTEAFKIQALPWFTQAMGYATEVTKNFVSFLMRHSHFVEGFMVAAAAAITYFLIPAAIRGALAVWAMIAPFALVGLAAAAVATIFALLYDDIVNFLNGNDSLIGQMLERWPLIGKTFETIRDAIADAWEVLKFFGEVAYDVARIVAREFGMAFDWIGDKLASLAEWIVAKLAPVAAFFVRLGSLIADAVAPATAAFRTFGQAVAAIIQFLIDKITAFIDKVGGVVGVAKSAAGWIRERLGDAKDTLGIKDAPKEAPPRADRLAPSPAAAPARAGRPAPSAPQGKAPAASVVPAPRQPRGEAGAQGSRASAPKSAPMFPRIEPPPAPPSRPRAAVLDPATAQAVAVGQAQLHAAATSPLTTQTTTQIAHSSMVRNGGNRTVNIDRVEVSTQATDAEGIARGIGETLGSHLRQATTQLDDGVAG